MSNLEFVSDDRLLKAFQASALIARDFKLSIFEAATLVAFLGFSENSAELNLVEVGMGGRLDATNTITHPEVSVITPISMDHQEFLGDTITAIAKEKAGIIRKNGRVILSAQTEDADSEIAAITQQLGASLHRVSDAEREMIAHPRCLKGDHQIENAATAAAALSIWKRDSVRITKEHILRGSETAQCSTSKRGLSLSKSNLRNSTLTEPTMRVRLTH